MIAVAIETAADTLFDGGGLFGLAEKLITGDDVDGAGGGLFVLVGMPADPPALAHTFAAALLASHPAAVMS